MHPGRTRNRFTSTWFRVLARLRVRFQSRPTTRRLCAAISPFARPRLSQSSPKSHKDTRCGMEVRVRTAGYAISAPEAPLKGCRCDLSCYCDKSVVADVTVWGPLRVSGVYVGDSITYRLVGIQSISARGDSPNWARMVLNYSVPKSVSSIGSSPNIASHSCLARSSASASASDISASRATLAVSWGESD